MVKDSRIKKIRKETAEIEKSRMADFSGYEFVQTSSVICEKTLGNSHISNNPNKSQKQKRLKT